MHRAKSRGKQAHLRSFVPFIVEAELCRAKPYQRMLQLRSHINLPVTAGFLLVGLPYSISLTAQWLYGWPNKPGYKKYTEALRPRRVYCLARAVLESLKYLQYGRLYIRWKTWYQDAENCKYYKKGISFGRRGNKLDLYYSPNTEKTKVPLVVFIYGGAWGSGERATYCLLAKHMAEELHATVVCPDYTTYPKSNVLGMVQDIADCFLWAKDNAQKFNFNHNNIILIGHSAGAHLCTLTTLFLIESREELFIEYSKQEDIASSIKGVIGLSGVYNILEHYEYEQMRGIEYVSTMHKAMNGVHNFPYYSPTHVLHTFGEEKLKRVPPFVLLHGTDDIIVPAESSTKFSGLLSSLSLSVELYLLPKLDHTEMATNIMAPDRPFYHSTYTCIKQEFSKLIKDIHTSEELIS